VINLLGEKKIVDFKICDCGGRMYYEGIFDKRVPQQHLYRCVHCGATKIDVRER